MNVKYRKGDLMSTDLPVIAHGCNAQGVMGSGVALLVKQYFPQAYSAYQDYYRAFGLQVGTNIWAKCGTKELVNCITQEFYGRVPGMTYVDYIGFSQCMKQIELEGTRRLEEGSPDAFTSFAMPKIGAGLGGGDWDHIENIMTVVFENIQPVVYTLT